MAERSGRTVTTHHGDSGAHAGLAAAVVITQARTALAGGRGAMSDAAQSHGRDALAGLLHDALARLAALDVPPEERARLHRQFIAVCDAAKTPGADPAACGRRLDRFLSVLDSVIAKNSRHKN